jgi:hypothetical protein
MSSMTPDRPDDDARDVEGSGLDGRDAQALSGAWYPDPRFADDNGDVPSFRPEPAPPGESDEEWTDRQAAEAEFDLLLAAWEAKHEGPDVVQDLPSWRADREAERADDEADEAGL